MIDFNFTAKEKGSNRVVKGIVQADNKQSAAKLLDEKNLYVVALDTKSASFWSGANIKILSGVKAKEKIIFTRQLATLVKAGLPITQAINTAVEQVENKVFKDILSKVQADVEGGASLSTAFSKYPEVFGRTYVSLVNAGEQSGTLDKALEKLATQLEKDHEVVSKVRGAMVYPLVVLIAIVGVVIFMVITVVPQIANLYQDLGKDLPFLTNALVGLSHFLQNFWWLVILFILAAVAGFRGYIRTPAGRKQVDKIKLEIPLFGNLFRKVYMTRFCGTLSVLLSSGVQILEALTITADAVNNVIIRQSVLEAANEVKSGTALSTIIAKKPYFLSLVPQMMKIGEDSGTLGDMLERVAKFYEDEVDSAVENISTLIEPILLVVMGIMVGIIILAVLFPVYNLAGNGLSNIGGSDNSNTTENAPAK